MNRRIVRTGSAAALVVAALGATPVAYAAAPHPAVDTVVDKATGADNAQLDHDKSSPLSDKQRALQKAAADAVATGKATVTTNAKGKKVVQVAKGQYVNYDVDREESIFTVLAEFGDKTLPATGGTPGPLHNTIPQPDRATDNTTIWTKDFDRAHYQDLMFGEGESFKDFYLKQSNGRFLAKGDVSDWVKVPYNEARYGHNPADGDGTDEAEQYWSFVQDTANAWYDKQKAAGKSDAEIKAYLAQFDKVDRYDYDHDGDFNEPDGYIDHFQAIHAGEGEEAGGGAEGEDAIWSHRWYAYGDRAGETGPAFNKAGGVQLGNSGMWIGDYTTEPENGGLGVFTHEFGHDLGLPDLYDTRGGANTTAFWTLMSSGSWLNDGTQDIGSKPGYMGPWEKLQLGWLDYAKVEHGTNTQVKLGPADRAGKMPQAILVTAPDSTKTTKLVAPHSGATQWWSGSRDKDDATLTRTVDLTGATSGSVSAWVATDLEDGFDYLYAEVSTDGGATWKRVGQVTGTTAYTQRTFDLSAYAGQKVQFRFHTVTDGGVHGLGAFVDDVTVTVGGKVVVTDGAETADAGWTAKDWTRVGASSSEKVKNYYLAENRTYSGYDRYLKTGPYNFGFLNTRPNWVEHFPYQDGLLVWFQNGMYTDNNTSKHPGGGLTLPVDARPQALRYPVSGVAAGSRVQPFDATFGLQPTDAITLHRNTTEVLNVPSRPAIPVFDDSDPNRYYDASVPSYSTKVAGSGTRIEVLNSSKQGDSMQVRVTFTK